MNHCFAEITCSLNQSYGLRAAHLIEFTKREFLKISIHVREIVKGGTTFVKNTLLLLQHTFSLLLQLSENLFNDCLHIHQTELPMKCKLFPCSTFSIYSSILALRSLAVGQ